MFHNLLLEQYISKSNCGFGVAKLRGKISFGRRGGRVWKMAMTSASKVKSCRLELKKGQKH